MIDRLVSHLRAVGFDFDSKALLDALWAARFDLRLPQPSLSIPILPRDPSGEAPGPLVVLPDSAKEPEVSVKAATSLQESQPSAVATSAEVSEGLLYAVAETKSSDPVLPASPIRIPAGRALPEMLDIVRALRVIPRRLESRVEVELDEEATVDATASANGQLTAVFRPALERWFKVALIVEQTPSMDMWAPIIVEVGRVLEYCGAFRDTRTWWLSMTDDRPVLVQDTGARAGIESLADPAGRQIVFLFTHGASEVWRSGRMGTLLRKWGEAGPVVLLHALPSTMWRDTALGDTTARVRSHTPGVPNQELKIEQLSWRRALRERTPSVAVPVMSLDGPSALRWAEMFMARKGRSAPAMLARTEAAPFTRRRVESASSSNAEERVGLFRAHSSPEAFRLAVHLAAGPITIPIVHLVQDLLFGTKASHRYVAEVMLSGIVERVTPVHAQIAPEQVQFRFEPEARKVLLRSLRRDDARELCLRVQDYIEGQFGGPHGFVTWMHDPSGTTAVPASAEPFVQLRSGFLEALGVKSVRRARRVTVPEDLVFVAAGASWAQTFEEIGVARVHHLGERIPRVERLVYGGNANLETIESLMRLDYQRQLILSDDVLPTGIRKLTQSSTADQTIVSGDWLRPTLYKLLNEDPSPLFSDWDRLLALLSGIARYDLYRTPLEGTPRVFLSLGQSSGQSSARATLMKRALNELSRLRYGVLPRRDDADVAVLAVSQEFSPQPGVDAAQNTGIPAILLSEGEAIQGCHYALRGSVETLEQDIDVALRLGKAHRVPTLPPWYIRRPELEEKLLDQLKRDRYVNLVGEGCRSFATAFAVSPRVRDFFRDGVFWGTEGLRKGDFDNFNLAQAVIDYDLRGTEGLTKRGAEKLLIGEEGSNEAPYWLTLRSSRRMSSFMIPRLTPSEAIAALRAGAGITSVEEAHYLWLFHEGDPRTLTRINRLLKTFPLQATKPYLEAMSGSDLVAEVTVPLAIAVNGDVGRALLSVRANPGGEIPVALAEALHFPMDDLEELGLVLRLKATVRITDSAHKAVSAESVPAQIHSAIVEACKDASNAALREYDLQYRPWHYAHAGELEKALDTIFDFDWLSRRAALGKSMLRVHLDYVEGLNEEARVLAGILSSFGTRPRERPADYLRALFHDHADLMKTGRLAKLYSVSGAARATLPPSQWILVVGTSVQEKFRREQRLAAVAVGNAVLFEGYGLLTRGKTGVAEVATEAAAKRAELWELPVEEWILHVLSEEGEFDPRYGRVKRYPSARALTRLIEKADAVVIIGGSRGTEHVFDAVHEAKKPIFALAGTGRFAERAFLALETSRYDSLKAPIYDSGSAKAVADALMIAIRDTLNAPKRR